MLQDLPPGASIWSYLVPLAAVAVVAVLRNSRPRRLKIDRLWLLPAIYMVLLIGTLYEAPPPVTPLSIGLLVAGFGIGAAIGWQRARLMQIHIHPETQDLVSRASPVGILFIFGVLVVRYAARDLLASNAATLHLPVVAISDAFIVLIVAMLSTQRLQVWRRATRMLAEAQAARGAPPPSSLVS
jgi:hypothetical protein